jgi:hypothetical protein
METLSPFPPPVPSSTSSSEGQSLDPTLPENYTGPFKLQIVSDLFLEIDNSYLTHVIDPKAPFLALLGNIGRVGNMCRVGRPSPIYSEFAQFLFRQLAQFRVVFFVARSHESHTGTWSETVAFFRVFSAVARQRRRQGEDLGEFVFLERTQYTFNMIGFDPHGRGRPVTVMGCTLFSLIPEQLAAKATAEVADFREIERWSVEKHNDSHLRDAEWLNVMLDDADEQPWYLRKVILTHFCPTLDPAAVHERDEAEGLARTVATEMGNTICGQNTAVELWGFGHTQRNYNVEVGGKTLLTNQRGHPHGPRGLVSRYDEDLVMWEMPDDAWEDEMDTEDEP